MQGNCAAACGSCSYCSDKLFSECDHTNPSEDMQKLYGDRISGFYGYSHLTGGIAGGQAEYVRVHHGEPPGYIADIGPCSVLDTLSLARSREMLMRVGLSDTSSAGPGRDHAVVSLHLGPVVE